MRIAALADSALVARRLLPVTALVVAAPAYLARTDGRHIRTTCGRSIASATPTGPGAGVWHSPDRTREASVVPAGPSRVTHADALLAVPLDGLGIAELPDFIAADYLADGRRRPCRRTGAGRRALLRHAERAGAAAEGRGGGGFFRRTVVPLGRAPGGGHVISDFGRQPGPTAALASVSRAA